MYILICHSSKGPEYDITDMALWDPDTMELSIKKQQKCLVKKQTIK